MLAAEVGTCLGNRGQTISVAESCTGGLLAKLLTDVPGSSAYFMVGLVTYADAAKERLLGVPAALLQRVGAVSEPVAIAMALGCRAKSGTDYAIAITGIAGPSGGTPDKPVGLIYLALADRSGCQARELRLDPNLPRQEIRERAANQALRWLKERLSGD